MEIREMTPAALSGWLKVARRPIGTAMKVLRNGDRGPRNAAMLAVDRVDASIRATVGSTLNDVELIADAQRRRVAADEREKALSLRVEAEEKREQADARAAQKQREAEQKRAA